MAQRKKIEVFSAGCHTCREAVETVRRIAGADHDVEVLDRVAARASSMASQRAERSGGRPSCGLLRWSRGG